MAKVAVKATAYCLNFAPELGLHYGTTPHMEHVAHPDSEFLKGLAANMQTYDQACGYAPNLTYIGAMSTDELTAHAQPWVDNYGKPQRFGAFGEIMPEDEFLGLLDICDVFDLIWLEKDFAAKVRVSLSKNPVMGEGQMKRLEEGHTTEEIEAEIKGNDALPLYFEGKLAGCCRKGHAVDENLSAHVLMENLASKAGGTLAVLHLLKNAGMDASEVDYIVECSEEAAGDMNQRGGGNIAKAIGESAGCINSSGLDVRGFCAGPVNAIIAGASMVACGARKNVVIVSGGAIPKLYMNSREHVKKGVVPLENCLGCFALLITPDDGTLPVIRLDALGKHTVGVGASPQAVTSALVWEPLEKAGICFRDVDKYAPELHIPEITLPAGAGNVPEANYKMIAALAVMKGQCDRADIPVFVEKHGLPGFAHTQGHIPSGIPFIGHAAKEIAAGRMQRAMIIGKGSLFLARLTNLADGASFLMEAGSPVEQGAAVGKEEVKKVLLDVLSELACELKSGPAGGR